MEGIAPLKKRQEILACALLASFLLVILTGCAGREFVRPSAQELILGETKYSELIESIGKPYAERSMEQRGKRYQIIEYAYSVAGAGVLVGGPVHSRAFVAIFYQDILVGYEYVSTYKEDSTDFDLEFYRKIKKGVTTESNVVSSLGDPHGVRIFPLAEQKGEKILIYSYGEVTSSVANMKGSTKSLYIVVDEDGFVSEHFRVSSNLELPM